MNRRWLKRVQGRSPAESQTAEQESPKILPPVLSVSFSYCALLVLSKVLFENDPRDSSWNTVQIRPTRMAQGNLPLRVHQSRSRSKTCHLGYIGFGDDRGIRN